MDSVLSYGWGWAARLPRSVAGVALSCLLASVGYGWADGMAALSNGAIVEWRIESGDDGPALGLSVPAFAKWTRGIFDDPVTVAMRSDGHAVVDAWQLAFYRAGDAAFARPLRRFRGDAGTLGDPVEWDGRVESGPPLRPGETVVARFETRDVAGNIDRAAPQEMLVARYVMPAERRSIASVEAERARALLQDEPLMPRGIPVRGSVLAMTVTDWLDAEGPRASGIRFRRRGKGWTLRQTLPPGPHEVVIQSARPIVGGVRTIPVGIVTVVGPAVQPFHAGVKGTGRLIRTPPTEAALSSGPFVPEGMVPGRAAISRPLTNRDRGEDRLALALIDPAAPVTLAVDPRKRMALLSGHGGAGGAWPRETRAHPLAEPSRRRVRVMLPVPTGRAMALPHTDITPGSLSLTAGRGRIALEPVRDYAVNEGEGRIRLTPSALSLLERERERMVDASYTVPVFAAEAGTAVGGGTWARPGSPGEGGSSAGEGERGMLVRAFRWLFGWG